jgi:cysteinyl-tRNA synthetase
MLGQGADDRNYLTQDIIRRILQDYFGYDVNFVMNITDIDDKVCPGSKQTGFRADDRSLSEQENRTSSNRPSNRTQTLRPSLWKRQKKHSRNT